MLHGRYFSLRDISKLDFEASIEQANLHHPTIKFTAETSATETVVYGCIQRHKIQGRIYD